jgi:uncharacterized membrane protein YgcG
VNRALTPEVRKLTGLPRVSYKPYPWRIALLMAAIGVIPLVVMGKWMFVALFLTVVLGVVPSVRWLEHREQIARERLFLEGREVVARVIDVEPAGAGRRDHVVRVEYLVDEVRVQGVVFGAPLARRGLRPGENVLVVYDPQTPQRCIVVERVKAEAIAAITAAAASAAGGESGATYRGMALPPPEEEEEDHGHAHGGCGGGGCGGGKCDGKGGSGGGCGGGGGGGGGGCGSGGCC